MVARQTRAAGAAALPLGLAVVLCGNDLDLTPGGNERGVNPVPFMPLFRSAVALPLLFVMKPTASRAGDNLVPPGSVEMKQSEVLKSAASQTLQRALLEETGWIKVHAAEALIGLGETEPARLEFEAELRRTAPKEFEIGTWRVLAASASSAAERAAWQARIAARLLEAGPDVATAIESLDKLGFRPSAGAVALARQMVANEPEQETLLPWWALALAGEPDALQRIVGKLVSQHPVARRRAGYVLRWLKPDDDGVRSALARAALAERPGTDVEVYLLSAALALRVSATHERAWVGRLQEVLLSETAEPHMRFEASHALASALGPGDLAQLAPLLQAAHGDVRIGSALVILHVLGPRRGAAQP